MQALAVWTYAAETSDAVLILPDGCRDLIVHRPRTGAAILSVSALDHGPRHAVIEAGSHLQGLRLPPGAVIDAPILQAHWREDDPLEGLTSALDEAVSLSPDVTEALGLIGDRLATADDTARALGVSLRSLQRLLIQTGAPFVYWRGLARARRCARLMIAQADRPLADIALTSGYADQAHMTREARRWLGVTPAGLRCDHRRAAIAAQIGYF